MKELNLILLSYYMKEKNLYNSFEKRENKFFFLRKCFLVIIYIYFIIYIFYLYL
jgi:hypothetical protein